VPSEDHDAQTDRSKSPLRDPLQERGADDLPKKCGGYKGEGERDVPPSTRRRKRRTARPLRPRKRN
jgi:hypothetical protein